MSMTPHQFVDKWRGVQLKERSAAQEHFIDVCRLVGHPTPAEYDPAGERFTFEKGAGKSAGGDGFADVWYRGRFAWEYKGKHADLARAYQQLLQYREALENPWLLIVSDLDRIVVHTNFPNTLKRTYTLTLDDLLTPQGLDTLRAAFYDPESLRPAQTAAQVTEEAAREFGRLAELLRQYGEAPDRVAHFLIRLLFCLFAEDVGLLPRGLFSRIIDQTRRKAPAFRAQMSQLFAAMAAGGWFGEHEIVHFDGGLFDDDEALALDSDSLDILAAVSKLDWASMEPSIIGTLFERSLDPAKRAQLGAHYTSKEDILLIAEPVLMAPLRRRWAEVAAEARALAGRRDAAAGEERGKLYGELARLIGGFIDEIATTRVLDPACGSGNFLYVALKQMLDLEKEVGVLAVELGLERPSPRVSPTQLYGIEVNEYAHELAQATVWIGYLQWLHENGFGRPDEPILKPLDNIKLMDAVLAHDAEGRSVEPEWPAAQVIIGNPPFLGDKKMLGELGDGYISQLRQLYRGRVPGQADLVCYWFERARCQIERGNSQRAGLLATQGIRGGANRRVLERLKKTGDIFWAISDREWILEGANVHVSMVGFDNAAQTERWLDGDPVVAINPDLTSAADLTRAERLIENTGLSFQGPVKVGPFDIDQPLAIQMLKSPNPNARSNSEVLRPLLNGSDITGRSRRKWIIDFAEMIKEEAALFEAPFEYVRRHVKPIRDSNRDRHRRTFWWRLGRSGSDFKQAVQGLSRVIFTPRIAKHRLFVFAPSDTIPDSAVVAITRDDDYFFGVLHARPHELWALRLGTALEDRPRYTPTTTFETYPFPWPPGKEPAGDPRVEAIAAAARELVEKRDAWLNPPGLSEAELKKRTLTNLYNERPTWLAMAHERLDAAVLAAYGWPAGLSDEEILARLLALNLERAAA